MLASSMLEFKKYLQANGILFCYCGYMTEDILMGIGSAMKKKLELDEIDRQTSKAAFSVFVEQVQNVIRYSAEAEPETDDVQLKFGIMTVGETEGKVFITCGNVIRHEDVKKLKTALENIKSLDRKGLKALWKETLKGETPEGSKGAGVGFIDIARRAKGGIEFDFTEVDEKNHFFALRAYI
jgi:Family of unknown function (DUF6272)